MEGKKLYLSKNLCKFVLH